MVANNIKIHPLVTGHGFGSMQITPIYNSLNQHGFSSDSLTILEKEAVVLRSGRQVSMNGPLCSEAPFWPWIRNAVRPFSVSLWLGLFYKESTSTPAAPHTNIHMIRVDIYICQHKTSGQAETKMWKQRLRWRHLPSSVGCSGSSGTAMGTFSSGTAFLGTSKDFSMFCFGEYYTGHLKLQDSK